MREENISNKIQKFFFSFQKKDSQYFLIVTVFVSILGIINVNIKVPEMKITDFEKKSFFDMMNILKKKK